MSKLNLDEFESVFIYKCLSDAQYLSLISSIVKDEYFSCKSRKIIFNKVKDFYNKRSVLPNLVELKSQLTSPEELASFKKVLTEVKDYNSLAFNEKELIDNTERFLKERALHETLMSVATDIKDDKVLDTSSILDKFEKNCNISLHTNLGLDLFSDVDKVVEDLTKSDPVIPSGWNWLDEKLNGGFRSEGKAIYIFAGQTNVGKSIFLGNLAVNIANTGRTVVLISLEMSEMIYARRLGAKVTAIPMKQLSEKCEDFSKKMKSYTSSNPNSRILIKEFPPSTITPRGLDSFLKSLVNKGIQIDAIVLDYINLLTTPEGNNSYEKIKYITEQVRSLTYLFNCPIITATQLNRCLDINSLVELESNEKIKICDLKIGDKILGESGYVTVRNVYPSTLKKAYKITTETGKEIICSGDHLFPVFDEDKNRKFISVYDGLSVGDILFSK
jgi:replicative DNA helicase